MHPMAKLVITLPEGGGTVSHELPEDTVTIGRVADNTIQIDDASVSSHHAQIVFEEGAWQLVDTDSTNGTFLGGERVTRAPLSDGAAVRFGGIECIFEGNGGSHPLPSADHAAPALAAAPVGNSSVRPADFHSWSPTPKVAETKDTVGMALIGGAVVAMLLAGGVVFLILQMASPV